MVLATHSTGLRCGLNWMYNRTAMQAGRFMCVERYTDMVKLKGYCCICDIYDT